MSLPNRQQTVAPRSPRPTRHLILEYHPAGHPVEEGRGDPPSAGGENVVRLICRLHVDGPGPGAKCEAILSYQLDCNVTAAEFVVHILERGVEADEESEDTDEDAHGDDVHEKGEEGEGL